MSHIEENDYLYNKTHKDNPKFSQLELAKALLNIRASKNMLNIEQWNFCSSLKAIAKYLLLFVFHNGAIDLFFMIFPSFSALTIP